jgi:D-alanyl-D-alanine carboxypeptidase
MRSFAILAVLFVALSAPAGADDDLQAFLDTTLKTARETRHLPAVAGLLQIDGKIVAETAIGVRAAGRAQAVTTGDLWHLGSDTKAITATMIARLVERGVMSFDDTLAKCFPGMAMNEAYRGVTIRQLLSHMAGLPPVTDGEKEFPEYNAVNQSVSGVRAQRAALAKHYLAKAPFKTPGTEFGYSNLGFIFAGAAAEARTGKRWEDLVRLEVFQPLGITRFGFGTPPSTKAIEQPWGHEPKDGKFRPTNPASQDSDNPPSLGPAGTIHMTLRDWMLFAQDQMDGAHGHGKLLKAETYRALHTPISSNGVYALGWGSKLGPDGVPLILTHSGSNGYWLADVRIWPKHNIVFLMAANVGGDEAETAFREVRAAIGEKLRPID